MWSENPRDTPSDNFMKEPMEQRVLETTIYQTKHAQSRHWCGTALNLPSQRLNATQTLVRTVQQPAPTPHSPPAIYPAPTPHSQSASHLPPRSPCGLLPRPALRQLNSRRLKPPWANQTEVVSDFRSLYLTGAAGWTVARGTEKSFAFRVLASRCSLHLIHSTHCTKDHAAIAPRESIKSIPNNTRFPPGLCRRLIKTRSSGTAPPRRRMLKALIY